jgi:hypothetical protein
MNLSFLKRYNKMSINNIDQDIAEKQSESNLLKVFVKNFHLLMKELVNKISAKLAKIKEYTPPAF